MYPKDEEQTTFIIDRGHYCYKVISLRLKNVATYQKLVNKIFVEFIGNKMKVYADDMLAKKQIDETSQILKRQR